MSVCVCVFLLVCEAIRIRGQVGNWLGRYLLTFQDISECFLK